MKESLKNLQPGETKTYGISKGGTQPVLTIECDRLLPGQKIEFDADLTGDNIKYLPTTNLLKGYSFPRNGEIVLYSAQGKLVSVQKCSKKGSVNTKGLPRGVYFLAIQYKGKVLPAFKIINIEK